MTNNLSVLVIQYNQRFVVFDFETEGLNLKYSRPWQLAWIECQGKNVVKRNDRYIDVPDLQISPEAARITRFSWDIYNKRKEDPTKVLEDFEKVLNDPEVIIIGQNVLGYDIYILEILREMVGAKPDFSYLARIYDTRMLGLAYREQLEKPRNEELLFWQLKIMNDRSLKSRSSQLQLLKLFDISFEENKLHDAIYDVEMCFKVFLELKRRMNL